MALGRDAAGVSLRLTLGNSVVVYRFSCYSQNSNEKGWLKPAAGAVGFGTNEAGHTVCVLALQGRDFTSLPLVGKRPNVVHAMAACEGTRFL